MKTSVSFILAIFLIFTSLNFVKFSKNNLTDKEKKGLLYMLEEEKLAKDVYNTFYEKWQTRQFGNIKESEAIHEQKIAELLDQNNISYKILPQGKFQNERLQNLYHNLILKGNLSETNALQVGATIEDLDIFDLENFTKETQNKDVKNVYNFLDCGSRNHIRAFNRGLQMNEISYKAQFITEEKLQGILNSDHEKCGRNN